MSGKFGHAVELVLHHEGGYVNNPRDPGGETKYGISRKHHPKVNIRALTIAEAQRIYLEEYWIPNRFDEIANETLAVKLFDLAVNVQPARAIKWLQRAVVAEGVRLSVDGVMGQVTLEAVNSMRPERLLVRVMAEAYQHYQRLGKHRPEFLPGWVKRLWSIG